MGFEANPGDPAHNCSTTGEGVLTLTGTGADVLLQSLFACVGGYSLTLGGAIKGIRPRPATATQHSFLDAPVASLRLVGVTPRDALVAVHRLVDEQYSLAGRRPRDPRAIPQDLLRKTAIIHVRDVTIRRVLNELALSFRDVSWTVDYPKGRADYRSSRIALWSTQIPGWAITANAIRAP
jgi:hypothetical protein